MLAGRLLQASVPVERFALTAGKRAHRKFQKGEEAPLVMPTTGATKQNSHVAISVITLTQLRVVSHLKRLTSLLPDISSKGPSSSLSHDKVEHNSVCRPG